MNILFIYKNYGSSLRNIFDLYYSNNAKQKKEKIINNNS